MFTNLLAVINVSNNRKCKVDTKMLHNKKNNSIISLIVLVILIFTTGCTQRPYEYQGEYPELYSIAINSLLGAKGYYQAGEQGIQDPEIIFIEEDEYGRTKISKIGIQKDETSGLINRLCLAKLIKELEKRDREIIVLRYICEKTQTEVARILGISQVQVSRIEKKCLNKMKEKIA